MWFTLAHVPFPHHGCLVSTYTEMFHHIWVVFVDLAVECHGSVDVVVGASQDGSARRSADAVCHIAVVEEHAFFGETVEIGCFVDVSP